MTSLFQARRRVEEFASAVDGGSRGTAVLSDEVVGLLEVVGSLRDQAPVAPRAEFAADLRSRLMLEAEAALDPVSATLLLPTRQRGRRERRLVAAASAFVLLGGTTTMAAAAQSALPGEVLYPIKRGIERASVQLNFTTSGKGQDLLRQAADRLVEVEGLVATGDARSAPQVPATLEAFSAAADEGSSLLFDSFLEDGDPEDVVTVRTFAAEGILTLRDLAESIPAEAQDELTSAALLLREIDREAAGLCSTCAPGLPVVEIPGIFLARAEVDRAFALAAVHGLDNDHPVQVPKAAVDSLRTPTTVDAGTTAETELDGATPSTPLPSPTVAPEPWPSLLTDAEKDPDPDGGLVDGFGSDLNTGLGTAVETLLPATDEDLLD